MSITLFFTFSGFWFICFLKRVGKEKVDKLSNMKATSDILYYYDFNHFPYQQPFIIVRKALLLFP